MGKEVWAVVLKACNLQASVGQRGAPLWLPFPSPMFEAEVCVAHATYRHAWCPHASKELLPTLCHLCTFCGLLGAGGCSHGEVCDRGRLGLA